MRFLPLVALLGCRPPPDVEPLACRNTEAGVAELGIGDVNSGFVPLQPGDPLPILFGPQGMHMVVVSIRVTDMEQSSGGPVGRVDVAIVQDDAIVGGTTAEIAPSAESDGIVDYLGLRAVFTAAEIDAIGDRDATLDGTVVDGCGRELTTSIDVWLEL